MNTPTIAGLALMLVACAEPSEFQPAQRVYVQDAELEAATDLALERWRCAVGVEWERVSGPRGADLVISKKEFPEDGPLARTSVKLGRMLVDVARSGADLETVLVHELGHALGAHHVEAEGVMRVTIDTASMCITAADLRAVCEEFACPQYQPECLATSEGW